MISINGAGANGSVIKKNTLIYTFDLDLDFDLYLTSHKLTQHEKCETIETFRKKTQTNRQNLGT